MCNGPGHRVVRLTAAVLAAGVCSGGCGWHSRNDSPGSEDASVDVKPLPAAKSADRTAPAASQGLASRMTGNREDAPPAPAKVLARPVSVIEADDFTVAEVGQNFIKFSKIFALILEDRDQPVPRRGLRSLKSTMPPEKFEQHALAMFKQELEDEIDDVLLFDETWKGLKPEEVQRLLGMAENDMARERTNFGSEARFQRQMAVQGVSKEQREEAFVRLEVLQYAYRERLGKRINIRPDELRAAYERLKDQYYALPGGIRFRVIEISAAGPKRTIDDRKDASPAEVRDALAAKLKAGADFAELARNYSEFNPKNGGWWQESGYYAEADLSEPAMRDALARLKPGECTAEPVTSANGRKWYFLKLEDRREKVYRPLDEDKAPEDLTSRAGDPNRAPRMRVSQHLRTLLQVEQRLALLKEEVARLRSKAYIGRYDEDLIVAGIRRRISEMK